MKGRMGGWIHWDHPQELLVGDQKAKFQGDKGKGQWEAVSWRLSWVSREQAPRKSHIGSGSPEHPPRRSWLKSLREHRKQKQQMSWDPRDNLLLAHKHPRG